MGNQKELDSIFSKLAREHGKLNDIQVASSIKEIGRVRGEVAELLTEFSGDDGTVKRQRLGRLLKELDGIEKSLRENGTVALERVVTESSNFATEGLNKGTEKILGIPMISAGIEKINKQSVDYVLRRFGDDGLVLSDRVWVMSGEIRDSISSVIRTGIIRGDGVGSMVRDVRKAYDNETWKIKRLVVTEANTAYRVASANSVKNSEVSDYVRINENGSRHRNHTNHTCYKLANADKYGEGNGVYKPTDTEIYMPHPQCSSYITAVLKEKYLTGEFGGGIDQPQSLGELNTVIPNELPRKRRSDFNGNEDEYLAYREKRKLRDAEINKAIDDTIAEITNRKQFLSTHAEAKEWISKNVMVKGYKVDIDDLDIRLVSLYCETFEKISTDIPLIKNSFKTFRYVDGKEVGGGLMEANNGISFMVNDLEDMVRKVSGNISSGYTAGRNIQDILTHEIGHNVDHALEFFGRDGMQGNMYGKKWRGDFFNNTLERDFAIARRSMSTLDDDVLEKFSDRLSEYAFTNDVEYFAEAFQAMYAGDTREDVLKFKTWFDDVVEKQASGKNRLVTDKEVERWFEDKLKGGS